MVEKTKNKDSNYVWTQIRVKKDAWKLLKIKAASEEKKANEVLEELLFEIDEPNTTRHCIDTSPIKIFNGSYHISISSDIRSLFGIKGEGLIEYEIRKFIPTSEEKMEKRNIFSDNKPERIIKGFLEQLKIPYEAQKRINFLDRSLKHYFCDFYLPKHNIVVECDGIYTHNFPYGLDRDKQKDLDLSKQGITVIRLWETEVKLLTLEKFKKILSKKTKEECKCFQPKK